MDKNDKTEGLLGGFKPILGAFSNDFEGVENPFASTNDMVDDLTDEEIEALKAKSAPPVPPVKEGVLKPIQKFLQAFVQENPFIDHLYIEQIKKCQLLSKKIFKTNFSY